MMIKAIDTYYNQHLFRSRLEARWAVYFDALGVKWEYESEGYDLGNGMRYLPDFYLPQLDYYVEIKPCPEKRNDFERWERFAGLIKKPLVVHYGLPNALTTPLIKGIGDVIAVVPLYNVICPEHGIFFICGGNYGADKGWQDEFKDHIIKAKTARFENFK